MENNIFFFTYLKKKPYGSGKYGVIRDGEIVLKPTFDEAIGFEDFDEDGGDMTHIGVVRKGKKWGVINSSLEEVVPFIYDKIDPHAVTYDCFYVTLDGKMGIHSLTGELIVPVIYDGVDHIRGLVRVRKGDEYEFFDVTSGAMLPILGAELKAHAGYEWYQRQTKHKGSSEFIAASERYDKVEGYSWQDMRPVKKGRKWGCIDSNGKEILAPIFQSVEPCGYSRRIVVKLKDKYGYFDYNGEQLTPIHYSYAGEHIENRAIVATDFFSYGFINTNGREVIPIKYYNVENFCNGRARIQDEDWNWGFIDVKGKKVTPAKYSYLTDFISDTAVYGIEDESGVNKYGLLSYDGVEITPAKYDMINYYGEDKSISFVRNDITYSGNEYAIVQLDRKLGLINKRGEELTPIIYDKMWGVVNGLMQVAIGNKHGVIDRSGREIIAPKYSEIDLSSMQFIGLKYRGKWAIADMNGKRITPFAMEAFGNEKVQIDGRWYYINARGEISNINLGGAITMIFSSSRFEHKLWRKIE